MIRSASFALRLGLSYWTDSLRNQINLVDYKRDEK